MTPYKGIQWWKGGLRDWSTRKESRREREIAKIKKVAGIGDIEQKTKKNVDPNAKIKN